MEIVRQLGKFVQKISVGLRGSDRRFVGDVLLGVVQRGLVEVHMGGRKRMMLLTWRVPKSSVEAAQWIQAYLRRWSVEDSARACKQLVGIEDVRVQSLRAIVRLAAIALGWLCLRVLFAPKTVAKILGRAKTVGREPLYLVYRLLEGIRHPA